MCLSIRRSDVPQYLRSGSFFESLDAQDDDTFDVPTGCFKNDASVESESELVLLLQTVRFWGLFVMPVHICEYILESGQSKDFERLPDLFPELTTYLECVLQAKESSVEDRIKAVIDAGLGVSIVRMLHEKGYAWNESACECAAQRNDVECLMYLHTEDCPWNATTLQAAVKCNSVSCLQYALDFGGFDADGMYAAMKTAASLGNTECMRILRAAGASWDRYTVSSAINGNQLEGCEISGNACCLAAIAVADIEILTYLHEVAGQSLIGVMYASVEFGNLDCMRYAHEHGELWRMDVCIVAAREGYLHCLRYAHENGCPWDDETALAAISARQWGCLMYALRHGRGWGTHLFMGFGFYHIMSFCTKSSGPIAYTGEWWRTKFLLCALPLLMVLMLYRNHFGKYLSARNADRIVQSFFCLLLLDVVEDGILEASWWMAALRAIIFIVCAGLLVLVNVRHVVIGTLPIDSPHWYQFHS